MNRVIIIFISLISLSTFSQQIQTNTHTTGPIQQVAGNDNTVVAVNSGVIIINQATQTANPYHLIKVKVNTASTIYLDGDSMGKAFVDKPLKIKVNSAGEYDLKIKSIYYSDLIINRTYTLTKDQLSTERIMTFNFKLSNYLYPVHNREGGKYGYLNYYTKELTVDFKYDMAQVFRNGIYPVMIANKWGYLDEYGNEVVAIKYDQCPNFERNDIGIAIYNKKSQIIDKSGKAIIAPIYDEIGNFSFGLAPFKTAGKWGYIDLNGIEVIPPKYSYVSAFCGDIAKVALGGVEVWAMGEGVRDEDRQENARWGLINSKGMEILPVEYDAILTEDQPGFTPIKIGDPSLHRYGLKKNNSWFFTHTGVDKCNSVKYDDMRAVNDKITRVSLNGKEGCIDSWCNEVIPIKYDGIDEFRDNIAKVYDHEKVAFVKDDGKFITGFIYDDATDFNNGFARVNKSGRCAYINKFGQEVTPYKYDCSEEGRYDNMSFGNCQVVRVNEKLGLIDKTGKELTPVIYDEIHYDEDEDFLSGSDKYGDKIGVVKLNGKFGYFDENGLQLTEIKYDYAGGFFNGNGVARVYRNNKAGLIDIHGKEILPPIYDHLEMYTNKIFEVEVEDRISYLNSKGECLWGCN